MTVEEGGWGQALNQFSCGWDVNEIILFNEVY